MHRFSQIGRKTGSGGHESILSVIFEKQGSGTLLKLVHSGLPTMKAAGGHEEGWKGFLDEFPKRFERTK